MTADSFDKEIIFYNQKIQEWRTSGLSISKFCKKNNIDTKRFCNIKQRIVYKSHSDPMRHKELIEIGNSYKTSNLSREEFAKKHNLTRAQLSELMGHLRYIEVIKSTQENTDKLLEEPQMNFIPVESKPETMPKVQLIEERNEEYIKAPNDLEIKISSGVKVSLSADVDSHKIIKIIEFLKEL